MNDLNQLLHEYKVTLDEQASSSDLLCYRLKLPQFPSGRLIKGAWLEIPRGFPDSEVARIRVPAEYTLEIPHVEKGGYLCIDGDPGSANGHTSCERVERLLDAFYSSFLEPWFRSELDNNFIKEAQNYWAIYCAERRNKFQAISRVFTTDNRNSSPKLYTSKLIDIRRDVIAGEGTSLRAGYIRSIGNGFKQTNVTTAEIPIAYPFTPENWPKNLADIERFISAKLCLKDSRKFLQSLKNNGRKIHRLVIFRAPSCSFGYLLPGGPPTIIKQDHSTKSYPNSSLCPLQVERLDVNWTTGRDQHREIEVRQTKHVLVVGSGALGSPTIEQLAKSGVGRLTILDPDILSTANIGRHTLGADSIGRSKAKELASDISKRWPSCHADGLNITVEEWINKNSLREVNLVLDLTGEPDVRHSIDQERKKNGVSLLIAWMEPFVAAAHACILPKGAPWKVDENDRLASLESVEWPSEIMMNEPACSSSFQSYTTTAAQYAVALTSEAALDLLDEKETTPIVRHWVRGQKYLDKCHSGLQLKPWAQEASEFDGVLIEKEYV